jgi:phosphatidate phosphatase APP1
VSASPWQMFESLNQWRDDSKFPFGTVHLRNFRLRDQLLKKVILHRKGKRSAIQKLIRNLPGRRYILIGDSGEKDPEIYCKISRKFPGNIVGLFIRELPDHPIAADRWQKICDDVPGAICERFTGGKDLQEKVARLFESQN